MSNTTRLQNEQLAKVYETIGRLERADIQRIEEASGLMIVHWACAELVKRGMIVRLGALPGGPCQLTYATVHAARRNRWQAV
jgi:hypothetical protein